MINKDDTIVVLGASGQIGHELTIALSDNGFENVKTPNVDMTKPDEIMKLSKLQADIIINCTAYTDVDKAESDETQCHMVNSVGVALLALLDTKIIHYSTDYVFSGESMNYNPEDETNPLNVYGQSKLIGETMLKKMNASALILRTSWVYSNRRKNFFKTILEKSMELDELKVVDDQFGRPTSAREIAIHTVYILGQPWKPGTYHLTACGLPCSWYKFALEIVKQAKNKGLPIKAKILPCSSDEYKTPVTRPKYSILNTRKLTEDYGNIINDWECGLDYYL